MPLSSRYGLQRDLEIRSGGKSPEIEALTQYLHGKVWWTTRSKSKNYSTPRLSTLQKSDNEAAFPYCGGLNLANSTQCLCAIMFTALNRFD